MICPPLYICRERGATLLGCDLVTNEQKAPRYNFAMESDSIVAAITPPGEGGVGVVRISGPLAPDLTSRLFPGLRGAWQSHRMRHGRLVDPAGGEVLDHALACLMT